MNIVEAATRRRVTVGMVTLTFVLFGLIALSGLKVNLLPDLSYPTLTVRTEYEGAAPLEMENLVSQPVEEAIGVVKNLRKIHSVSRTGQSDVILEFSWGTNMDQAGLDVRDKLDILQLPLEAKKPVLLRFNPSTDPIMRLSLSAAGAQGKHVSEAELKQLRRFADDELKKRLEPTPGVAAVKVGGGLEDEVDVDIDQQRLQQLGLNAADVVKRLADENVNVSGGRIESGSQRYLVRTVNQFGTLDEMRNLLIKVDNGVPVHLKDIAQVRQGYKEREGIVRVDGHESIEFAIYKEGDANTVSVAENVRKQLDRLTCANAQGNCTSILPANAKLDTIDDQSIFIQSSLDDVRKDALIGGILAILIIFFFLKDVRSTFIIFLSLPISLITTFFFMGQAGVSLNVMSLGGLGACHRHGGRRFDRRARKHCAPARKRHGHLRSGGERCARSLDGGNRVDADYRRRIFPACVRAGRSRAVVPRPGADDHVCDADIADRCDDPDSHARFAARVALRSRTKRSNRTRNLCGARPGAPRWLLSLGRSVYVCRTCCELCCSLSHWHRRLS